MYHDQSFGVRSEMPVSGTSLSSLNLNSLHGYRNYLKAEVLEETTQKTTQKTTQNLENEENIIYHD